MVCQLFHTCRREIAWFRMPRCETILRLRAAYVPRTVSTCTSGGTKPVPCVSTSKRCFLVHRRSLPTRTVHTCSRYTIRLTLKHLPLLRTFLNYAYAASYASSVRWSGAGRCRSCRVSDCSWVSSFRFQSPAQRFLWCAYSAAFTTKRISSLYRWLHRRELTGHMTQF